MIISVKEYQLRETTRAHHEEGVLQPATLSRVPTGKEWDINIPDDAATSVRNDIVWQIDNLISRLSMVMQDAASSFRR